MKSILSGKSILLVEDNPVIRKATREMLFSLDAYDVVEVDNGVSAIRELNKARFDIVLCDYNLGNGKNGQQVLEEVRHRKLIDYRCIFVLLSNEQSTSSVLGAMDSKPDDYLTKPFNAQQLLSRLTRSFAHKECFLPIDKALAQGHTAQAIAHCDRLLVSDDNKMTLHLLKTRAELAIASEDFEKAKQIYQQVLSHRELSWARLGLGIVDFHNHQLEQAVDSFKGFVAENPMLMEGYDWLIKAYETLGQYQEAEAALQEALVLSPQSILRQKKLALIADKNGNTELAEQAYKEVIKIGKHSVHRECSDFIGLAQLYAKHQSADEALQALAAMRQEYINQPEAELRACVLEVDVYKTLGNEEQLESALQKSLDLTGLLGNEVPRELQLEVAKTCFVNNRQAQAEALLGGLIKSHCDDDGFLNALRQMQDEVGLNDHSEVLIQKTKQALINANNQGVSLYKQGKYQEALDVFERAIQTLPDNKTIILNMLKIMIHDLKVNEYQQDKSRRTNALLKKAQQIGVDADKLGILQREYAKLISQLTKTPHAAK